MTINKTIQTTWQAEAPWYKTGLQPITDIINQWVNENAINSNETGLIFLCEDGGYDACIDLWKMAMEQGVRFVNPAAFPYSLSSSPAGFVAKACNIYGPAFILVQKDEDKINEELNVYAHQIFFQQITHVFIVKAILYNNAYQYSATVSLCTA